MLFVRNVVRIYTLCTAFAIAKTKIVIIHATNAQNSAKALLLEKSKLFIGYSLLFFRLASLQAEWYT